ncbi:uncharacterized protein SPAPADRAFT_54071 [Spathaspora passalidarum NRRL Y-27907]|uniref:Vacuolar ATPase assembly protein VMA22 n=1 Tax=Spathaspora passalidarum (strain NRRL Y-27907 / 11-Y1) TaxID=619300 RepID=G3AIX3_SPAPN|nr:uncharacterized protein SPAPADRAFT_54071 [Spathaspora passalidarum NRRL Y-27907]EGW33784.1 hypothetical protein SPAPADRAFT_54071 [Spathaspora passalidarum NRRL Y-27907]
MTEIQSQLDKKTIELLILIDKYENVVNNNYRTNFINGFVNLSKANYEHTGRGFERRYGVDSLDLRPRLACLEVNEEFHLVDLQQKTKKEEKREQMESSLKNRKTKQTKSKSSGVEEFEEDKVKDPMLQFGGIVPYQLRQSQAFFKKAIENSLEVVKLQQEIDTLIQEIEKLR